MTALAGEKPVSIASGILNPRISASLSAYTVEYWQSARFDEFPTNTSQTRTYATPYDWSPGGNLPVSQGLGERDTMMIRSYKQDFYYRVHLRPTVIDFGNLVNTETREVTVWNAFFEPVFFSASGNPSQPGITYTIFPEIELPYTMAPLREVKLVVTANISGPPVIDADFTITIDGVVTTIHSDGRRIAIFPFPPNWRNGVETTVAFQSWELRSSNGSVQTGSQWGNNPRQELDYTILLTRDDAARAENLIMGWQSRFYGAVVWPEETKLTAPVVVDSRSIYCDTRYRSFAPGGFVILYKDSTTYESAEIDTVTDSLITVTSDLRLPWATGTRVYPVFAGLINATLSPKRHTDGVLEMPVSFESEPSSTYGNTPAGEPALLYRGVELFLGRINWVDGIDSHFESDRFVFDYQTGRTRSHSSSNFTPQQKRHTWLFKNLAEIAEFRSWLGRREGIAKPCYIPTGNSDLTLIEDPQDAALHIDVIDNEYVSMLGAHPIRRDIILIMRDGSYYARRVTGVAQITGGARISVDTPWPANIPSASVKRISFLGLFRQVSNKVTIWQGAQGKGTAEVLLKNDKAPD